MMTVVDVHLMTRLMSSYDPGARHLSYSLPQVPRVTRRVRPEAGNGQVLAARQVGFSCPSKAMRTDLLHQHKPTQAIPDV
jgi:hypothetical protein